MLPEILQSVYFNRPTLEITQDLLGKYLCRRLPNGDTCALQLNELEAYDGPRDKAFHAHKGRTPRNTVMFGPAGYYYVYLCYGMHWMLNIVVGEVDYPAAILVRGAGNIIGPGRLTKALKIDKSHDGQAIHPNADLWIEDRQASVTDEDIERTPRIGIGYASEYWQQKPYRFVLKNSLDSQ